RRGQLPGEVHRIPDSGVHALAADRAVDMGGVTQQERAPFLEAVGDAMMDAIRREPVDTLNIEAHAAEEILTDVVPGQRLLLRRRLLAHDADEPHAPVALQRED